MSNKPKPKSQQFRELHDQGYMIAEIAKATKSYYSFVHRVIARYTQEQGQSLHVNKEQRFQEQNKVPRTQVKALAEKGYDTDAILNSLNLTEDQRSQVYAIVRELKAQDKNNPAASTNT